MAAPVRGDAQAAGARAPAGGVERRAQRSWASSGGRSSSEAIGRSRAGAAAGQPGVLWRRTSSWSEELPALIERGVRLVCVLVRPCLWEQVGDAGGACSGRTTRAATGRWRASSDPEGQIVRVCEQLLELAAARGRGGDGRRPSRRWWPAAAGLTRRRWRSGAARPGELHGVPALPPAFVAREELAGLRDALLRGGRRRGRDHRQRRALGLHGQGGIGKTVLAAALARDDGGAPALSRRRVLGHGRRARRPGRGADRPARAARASRTPSCARRAEGLALLRAALAERRCLLVIDDVWSAARRGGVSRHRAARARAVHDARPRRAAGGRRATSSASRCCPITGRARAARRPDRRAPVDACQPKPTRCWRRPVACALALALVGAAIGRGGRTWTDVAAELERGGETFLDHPYANTFKAMQVGVAALDRRAGRGVPQPGRLSRGHARSRWPRSRATGATCSTARRRRSAAR